MESNGLIKSPYNLKTRTFMTAEPKTVNLTLGERLGALKLLDQFKGGMATLRVILEDVKQFPITDDEWKAANLVKSPAGDGTENWKWDDLPASNKEITIQPETAAYLAAAIKAKSDAGDISLADVALSTLETKLQ